MIVLLLIFAGVMVLAVVVTVVALRRAPDGYEQATGLQVSARTPDSGAPGDWANAREGPAPHGISGRPADADGGFLATS